MKIKKLIAEIVLIISPFYKFTKEEIHKIEEGFASYYEVAAQKFGADQLDKAIFRYSKENKGKI